MLIGRPAITLPNASLNGRGAHRASVSSSAAALKQEQGIMADKHSKSPKPPNDNAKSIDRWDDEGGAPSGGRSVRKRPRRDRAKRSSSRGRLRTSSSRVKGRMSTAI